MMKLLVWLSSLILAILGHNVDKPKLTFDQIGNTVRFFQTAPICGHKSDIRTQHDIEGRLTISYKANVGPDESDDDLCECMWKYLNQNCAMKNLERKCIIRGTKLTLYVTGPPNPSYDPRQPFPKVNAPVALLSELLKHYSSKELADHWCSSANKKLADGQTCFSIQCKITAKSPEPEKICAGILDKINQHDWLGTFEQSCSCRNGKLFLEINGE